MLEQLRKSIETGLIDKTTLSLEDQRPSLLLNNKNTKVINYIRKELESCDEFYFSVAFITEGGLSLLLHTLNVLNEKGISGKMITSDYLRFNDPKVFKKLLSIPNLEVRINKTSNFHAKGYIFKHNNDYSIIIGSSNLTQDALTKNAEWNLKVTSTQNGQLIADSLDEFFNVWNQSTNLDIEWINAYENIYKNVLHFDYYTSEQQSNTIKPNKMQLEALKRLAYLRKCGSNKGLLISATGTGKTFLSAFDVAQVKPRRLLFIAHRERLLKSAEASFKKIIHDINTGFYTSAQKNENADYIFASVSTICKSEHLYNFLPEDFDYIIIDEVHRAGAPSYQKILSFFKPKFLLGMTATPERTDDYNIYQLFDYKIAYEIRLQQALEEEMLCPFHYYGISEISINGELLSDLSDFKNLVCDLRVNHIIEKANYYGYSGNRVKGLIFCSRNEEATALSQAFNAKGFHTISLSGNNTDEEREMAISRLEQDEYENSLDYIFTVDIFNEGIDIPAVNQIIMLRKTKSSIVFIQQLGRGLRKYSNKHYVVILDFIGNYDNNFLIPISLSGDKTYNKDNLRKFMNNANTIIPGNSSIEFDTIIKEKIFKAINIAKFDEANFIKSEYINLKNKMGVIPSHLDFLNYEAIDLQNIIKKYKSYINFLMKYEHNHQWSFNENEIKYFEFFSKELSSGKRIEEIEIIHLLIQYHQLTSKEITMHLSVYHDYENNPLPIISALQFLQGGFLRPSEWKTYNNIQLIQIKNNMIEFDPLFKDCLNHLEFKEWLLDLLKYSKQNYLNKYSPSYQNTRFVLYEKYTRKDVCRLLNWSTNEVPLNIGGYKYDAQTNTMAVYVTYEKNDNISDTIKYEDRFINRNLIVCVSKNRRNLSSPEIVRIYNKQNNVKIHLFMNRLKEEEEFYYMGLVETYGEPQLITRENNDTVVDIIYKLDQPVREDIYHFITT